MATPTYNYLWPQGEDLDITFTYKEGPDGEEVPVDLDGYTVRMDLVHPVTGAVIYMFNTAEQENPDEIVVNSGGDGIVLISVPRGLTLPPTGAVYEVMNDESITVFNYDIFVRNPSNKQKKMYRGTITIEPSYTLWA